VPQLRQVRGLLPESLVGEIQLAGRIPGRNQARRRQENLVARYLRERLTDEEQATLMVGFQVFEVLAHQCCVNSLRKILTDKEQATL
jgi:ribosomal 50S subunit-associated protein YjgA (DUF615 family)